MSLTEFNEKEYIDLIRQEEAEENLEKGRKEGIGIGRKEGVEFLSSLINILFENGRIEDIHRVSNDSVYRDQLLKEYALI